MKSSRRVIAALVAFLLVFLTGAVGFKVIGGSEWSFLDSVWMTVITLSTVGYGEPHDAAGNAALRAFTVVINLICLGTIAFAITSITAFIVEGELKDYLGRRKMDKKISRLKGHDIVCGADETARAIIQELMLTKRPFVAVDASAENLARVREMGDVLCFQGDPTEDETLRRAGIERARGILLSLPTDEENLFVTLSARGLNPKLRIVAKGVELQSHAKFRKAGADVVVSPTHIGGMRMVSEMVRPAAATFLDMMLRDRKRALRVEEVEVGEGSELAGKSVAGAKIGDRTGVLVMAVRKSGSEDYVFNPSKTTTIERGDVLIVVADPAEMITLRRMAAAG
jgi:voltage-gated potassium channel